jgi:hypothetical protein
MNLNRYSIIALVLLMLGSTSAIAQQDGWPRTVALDEGMVTIYAPQLEAMDGGVLYYRAALAYRADADAEPIFGAGWLKSTVEIDEKNDIVEPAGMELTQTRFPDGTTDIEAELATALTRQSIRWNLDFTVAELEAALDAAEAESLAAQRLKSTPPKITYRDRPAILVSIDGDPVLREIEESPYQAVINTPFPLITDGKSYYLNAAKGAWYRATAVAGPYRFDKSPPEDIVEMVESAEQKSQTGSQSESDQKEPETPITAENAPEIVVSTVPAELIVTEGPADFVPLVEDLLVLKNSNSDVFLHVGDQKYYIVLSGRWYQSGSLAGPWENQPADELPAAFAQIPEDSAQADSRPKKPYSTHRFPRLLRLNVAKSKSMLLTTENRILNRSKAPRICSMHVTRALQSWNLTVFITCWRTESGTSRIRRTAPGSSLTTGLVNSKPSSPARLFTTPSTSTCTTRRRKSSMWVTRPATWEVMFTVPHWFTAPVTTTGPGCHLITITRASAHGDSVWDTAITAAGVSGSAGTTAAGI